MPPNIHCRASSSVKGADSLSHAPGLHTQAYMPCMLCWGKGFHCLAAIGYRASD